MPSPSQNDGVVRRALCSGGLTALCAFIWLCVDHLYALAWFNGMMLWSMKNTGGPNVETDNDNAHDVAEQSGAKCPGECVEGFVLLKRRLAPSSGSKLSEKSDPTEYLPSSTRRPIDRTSRGAVMTPGPIHTNSDGKMKMRNKPRR